MLKYVGGNRSGVREESVIDDASGGGAIGCGEATLSADETVQTERKTEARFTNFTPSSSAKRSALCLIQTAFLLSDKDLQTGLRQRLMQRAGSSGCAVTDFVSCEEPPLLQSGFVLPTPR